MPKYGPQPFYLALHHEQNTRNRFLVKHVTKKNISIHKFQVHFTLKLTQEKHR